MSIELVKALLQIVKTCASATDCRKCAIKEFCKKSPIEW